MKIGLDFGTTNSSAAVYGKNQLQIIKSRFSEKSGILPSLIYVTKEQEKYFGKEAAFRYLQDDTGRLAQWKTYHAGMIEYWIGTDPEPELVQEDIWLQVDIGAKGRLLQSIKTALRSSHYVGTSIFGQFYTIEDLIALLLREFHAATEATLHRKVKSVLLGRPVKFNDDPEVDKRSQIILRDAAKAAGFEKVSFMAEPIAAAYSYHLKSTNRQTALVFDFGGGTLDLAVVRLGGENDPEVLSTEGVSIGGDDFDQRIMERFLLKHFGYEKPYADNLRLPYEVYDYLLSWPRHPDLTRGKLYINIRNAAFTCKDKPDFKALLSLIDNKHGFRLFETIEATKIELSNKTKTILSFHEDGIDIDEEITRADFTQSIQDFCSRIDDGVVNVLDNANLEPKNINLVLCTGGSSSVPAVIDLLVKRFGEERIRMYDQFLSVTSGLAIAASRFS